jgi:hypothetical protein
MRHKLSDI